MVTFSAILRYNCINNTNSIETTSQALTNSEGYSSAKTKIGYKRKILATNNKNIYFCNAKHINRMQTTTTTIRQTNSTTSSRQKKKAYPKTLKGCFSFEEFQDLLNEKIREHYEKV